MQARGGSATRRGPSALTGSPRTGARASLRPGCGPAGILFAESGHVAAWLATDFRALTRASHRWGALVVPLQLPVLLAWCPARAVSLVSFAACRAIAPRLA